MRRRGAWTLLVVVVLVASVAGVGLAQQDGFVRGHPELDVFAPDPTLVPGTTTELSLQVANSGEVTGGTSNQPELVTTARNVRVEVDAGDAPITIESGRQSIGQVPGGQATSVPIAVTVPEGAAPGTYELDVELEYAYYGVYSARSDVFQDERRTVTRTVEVEVDDRPRFALRTVDSDVQVGQSGTLRVAVENVGEQSGRDLDVRLESTGPEVTFGTGQAGSARVDQLAPGETAIVAYDVRVGEDAAVQAYPLDGSVRFTDPDGVRLADEGLTAGLLPVSEQTFAVRDVESDLHVGETGRVRFTVANTGPRRVTDATLLVNATGLRVQEPEYALGTLDPGEERRVEVPVAVARSADPIPHRLALRTEYETAGGDSARAEPLYAVVGVSPERNRLALEGVETNVSIDETNELVLAVRNVDDVAFRNVTVRLSPDRPFSSVSPTAYVAVLEPGETARLHYELTVDEDAVPSTQGVPVAVSAEEPDGDVYRGDPEPVAVRVVRQGTFQQDWIVVLIGGVLVALALLVGYVVTRRA